MKPPSLTPVAELIIEVGAPVAIGETPDGLRRIVPILGGVIRGEHLNGTVLAAGADYQLIRADGYSTLDARYAAKLEDGSLIYIVNTGVRFGPPDIMARITRGKPVDPAQVYFRTVPRFETASPHHAWLTRPVFIGSGERYPDRVLINVFAVE